MSNVSYQITDQQYANEHQKEFMEDFYSPFLGFAGGWRSSKTYSGVWKLLYLHSVVNAWKDDGQPTFIASLIVEPSLKLLKTTAVEYLQTIGEKMNLTIEYAGPIKGYCEIKELSSKKHKSLIYLRSAASPHEIRAFEVGAALCDEAACYRWDVDNPKNDAITQTISRVAAVGARFKQCLFTSTNEGSATKFFYMFYTHQPGHRLITAKTTENIYLDQDYIENQLKSLAPELHEQYLFGGVVNRALTLAYPGWDARWNIKDEAKFDFNLPLCLCMDFGIARGTYIALAQWDEKNDQITIHEEIQAARMDTQKAMLFLRQFLSTSALKFPEIQVFGDRSGKDPDDAQSVSSYQIVSQYLNQMNVKWKLRVPDNAPGVRERVNAMNLALCDISGKRHLTVTSRCKKFIRDMEQVKWSDKPKEPLGKGADKSLTHASDAVCYFVQQVRPVQTAKPLIRTPSKFSVTVSK
jgi:hypothetical protein